MWQWICEFLAFFENCWPKPFWNFLWLQTCELLAFFHDRGPQSFWHFSVTMLHVCGIFQWPWTCDSLVILVTVDVRVLLFFVDHGPASFCCFSLTADLRVFVVFRWPRTCKFFALFQICWPEHFWHFSWPQTCEFMAIFHYRRPVRFRHFLWLRTCELLAFFQNSWPKHLKDFFVTADHVVFGILSPRCELVVFFYDREPAIFWYF